VKRRAYILPKIALDRSSSKTLHRQIVDQITWAIRAGSAGEGGWLPSSRRLAALLGISRNTALAAYDQLAAEGLVMGERGSGMRVGWTPCAIPPARRLLRDAQYPARTATFEDPDGNPAYFNF